MFLVIPNGRKTEKLSTMLLSKPQMYSPWCVPTEPGRCQQLTLGFRTPKFKFAENPETRRSAHEGYDNRLAMNAPLFAKALDLRRQIAKLLQYPTWADYRTEVKMVKTAANVRTVCVFLNTGDTFIQRRITRLVPRRLTEKTPPCWGEGPRNVA